MGGRHGEYPLRAARELKDQAVDEAAQTLAAATEATRAARSAVDAGRKRLAGHEAETRAWEARETSRGAGSAATFQTVQAYRERRAAERTSLRGELDQALTTLASREAEETAAREALAAARAEAEAVERHEARWREARRREAEKKAELEAEDVAQARRFRRLPREE